MQKSPQIPPKGHKVAIVGGSFDPPGLHHMIVHTIYKLGAELLNFGVADHVCFIPCGKRHDKKLANNPQSRLEMLNLSISDYFGPFSDKISVF